MATKLTPLQRRFVQEYLVDLNATQSAIRAGYSRRTAYSMGHQNLRKLEIVRAIETAMQERAARTQVNADSVVEEYALVAFARSPRLGAFVLSIRDKLAALNALAKHINLWPLQGTKADPLHLIIGTEETDLSTKTPEELKRIEDAITVLLEAQGIIDDARAESLQGESPE
jgi:hypothetical protein